MPEEHKAGDATEGGNSKARAGRRIRGAASAIGREAVRATVVESLTAGLRWLGVAVVAGTASALARLSTADSAEALAAIGSAVAVLLLIPPAVGLARALGLSRPRNRRSDLLRDLEEVEVERDALVGRVEQGQRADYVLADWLAGMLIDPFRVRSNDPDRDFEHWLNDIVHNVLRVVLPGSDTVGLALVVEVDEEYVITHRSAGVPADVVRLTPAPAHRQLGECIKRHAPNAETFSFYADGHRHFIIVFPETPIDTLRGAPIMTVAVMIAHVFRQLGLS